ncbi:MAG TPA: lycopene cyclase domain-containing protein [Rhodothermales bacterium]|nr:lycopene cyclase domain-containing protein [Rhodothermales bacterium]
MTYLQFHLAFIVPVVIALAMIVGGTKRYEPGALRALGLIVLAALVATTPWDNYLVYRGVWNYGVDRVIGTIGYVPIEEYLFFVLQPLMGGLAYFLARRHLRPLTGPTPAWVRPGLIAFWLMGTIAGVLCLTVGSPRALYLGLILAWACPILAGMSVLGAAHIRADLRAIVLSIGLTSLYLWVADRIAIGLEIWDIADEYSLPFEPFGLPIEEAVFFLLTTTLCVNGLALLLPVRTARGTPGR